MAGVRARECAWLVMAMAAGLLAAMMPSPAHAQTAAESLDQARNAYTRGEFREVVTLLEPIVGGAVPTIHDRILVRESRKYLGAAYVLTGERARAEEQFAELLRDEGDGFATYRLDRATFPSEVTRVFGAVQERLVEAQRDEATARRARELEREAERQEALVTLLSLAQVDEVTIRHDPAIAWIPFGAGQFQNGNEGLGAFFFGAEAASLLSALVTLAIWVPLEDTRTSAGITPNPDLIAALRGLQIANVVSFGAFGLLAIAGIFEAHISFVPSHTVRRERDIPADVLERLELSVGPGSVGLRLSF